MVGRVVVVAGVAGVDHIVLYGGGMASLYHLVAHLHTPELQESCYKKEVFQTRH